MTPAEVRLIDQAASKRKLSRSEWMRRAVRRQTKRPASANWPEHWAWLEKHGQAVEGHPADQIRALQR
jgi:hypothetical protein